jgi:arylsulfatase A-like enzyme
VRAGPGLALAAGLALGSCDSAGPEPPNILLISIDSLRADHLGCYGRRTPSGLSPSPVLDALAGRSVVFENAVSTTSWTMPAHHALFSGRPDLLHGAIDDWHGPTPRRTVLAEALQRRGYRTVGYFSGPYLQAAYGFAQGFDEYRNATGLPMPEELSPPAQDWAETEALFHQASTADRVTRAGLEALEAAATEDSRPLFLFLHYFDVHYDYLPPEERFAFQFLAGRRPRLTGENFMSNPEVHAGMDPAELADVEAYYDGEIYWVDSQIGLLLDRLATLGLADDTVVVVVSDHGDEFFEHGEKGHRKNLFEPTLHIPLILHLPDGGSAGLRIPARVSLADVAPTLLELAGSEAAGNDPVSPASSLLPLLHGDRDALRDALGFLHDATSDPERPVHHWALWTGDLKVYVRQVTERGEDGSVHRFGAVYDLAKDPGETRNLAASEDPAVQAAIRRYEELHAEILRRSRDLPAGAPPRFLDQSLEDQRRELEALGYALPERVSEHSVVTPPPFPRDQP